MNILYIGDLNSIHDFKWVTFFSKKEECNIFFLSARINHRKYLKNPKLDWELNRVEILSPIDSFSVFNPLKTYKSIKYLKTVLKSRKIELVHVLFGSPQPMYLSFLPKELPKVITTRGSDVLVMLKGLKESKKIIDRFILRLLVKGLNSANLIVSTSSGQIDYLKNVVEPKVKLEFVKTGVDVEKIRDVDVTKRVSTKLPKYIFSGRYIAPVYNMEYQLEAIRLLPSKILNEYSFLFVKSQNHSEQFITDFINKLKKVPNLKFDVIEGVGQQEMWATIKKAALVFMVPKSDGTPNTALECMAARTPFIMGDLAYNEELFGGTSLRVDLSSPENFAKLIEQSLDSYPAELIEKGYSKVQQLGSREAEMSKLSNFYKELLLK